MFCQSCSSCAAKKSQMPGCKLLRSLRFCIVMILNSVRVFCVLCLCACVLVSILSQMAGCKKMSQMDCKWLRSLRFCIVMIRLSYSSQNPGTSYARSGTEPRNSWTFGDFGPSDRFEKGSNVHTWSIWHQTVSDHFDAQAWYRLRRCQIYRAGFRVFNFRVFFRLKLWELPLSCEICRNGRSLMARLGQITFNQKWRRSE